MRPGGRPGRILPSTFLHWVRSGQIPPDAALWPDDGVGWLTLTQAWPLLTGVPGALPDVPTAPLPPPGQTVPPGRPQPPAGAGPSPGRNPVQAFTDRLADFAGVERLDGFRPRDLLSATFHRYTREELEQRFATGLPDSQPQLARSSPAGRSPGCSSGCSPGPVCCSSASCS